MANTEKTVTVKLVLDTTEWDAALARVKAAIAELGETRIGAHVVGSPTIAGGTVTGIDGGILTNPISAHLRR